MRVECESKSKTFKDIVASWMSLLSLTFLEQKIDFYFTGFINTRNLQLYELVGY